MSELLKNVCFKYQKSVSENPNVIGQVETGFRLLSYIVAGRFQDSQIISELMYSASNLLVLMNDAILKGTSKIEQILPLSIERLMRYLTIIEYIEVFVEITALRMSGSIGRWVVILVIQIAKAAFRLILLTRYNAGIQPTPPITPLNRESIIAESRSGHQSTTTDDTISSDQLVPEMTFKLTRSGRSIRKLEATPAMHLRKWNLPVENKSSKERHTILTPTVLDRQRIWAEGIHIIKPLIHLATLYKCGQASWKPWLLSCGFDISSLCMMGEPFDLNSNEKGELRRRTFMLLFYLLRSPFFDRFSQAKIIFMLKILADNIPGISLLIRPFIEYLPQWQKCYFYTWSS
ncbi:hypothetical protein SNE40_011572 [Patella caerulea]|uniref:Peroxisomal membrane protein PEX16 n=1 Tax=Patella caerulea TaxID=87958 RepID=A0AAN8JN01_PATCE